MTSSSHDIERLLKDKTGVKLDICCGSNKQGPEWIGIDLQPLPGVDIVWDVNIHPWPLPDECAIGALASHILEHIPTVAVTEKGTRFPFLEFMNEVWRILKPDGQLAIASPHGASEGFLQDPTHVHPFNQVLFMYFDPLAADGVLYKFYHPKPWKIETDASNQPFLYFDPSGNIETVLVKRREDRSYYE